jgi:hypothetical protein
MAAASGTRTCPDFNDALTRHRMIAAIDDGASDASQITLPADVA